MPNGCLPSLAVVYDTGEVCTCRAEDTGSGIKGNHIDICVAGHEEAKSLGIRRGTVYWEEAEHETIDN